MDPSKIYNQEIIAPNARSINPGDNDPMELLTMMDDPRYRGTPAGLISEDLNYLLEEIVHCDNTYCYDLRDMIFEAIQLVLSHQDPVTMRKIANCTRSGDDEEACTELYANAFASHNVAVFKMIETKRQELSPDPLDNYDGTLYESQFWFSHAGDIWRRITHQSRLVDVERDCGRLKQLADHCLNDDSISHKDCLNIYSHSLACAPGSYCPYLRQPLMTCMHGSGIADYDAMRQCVTRIPNYEQCERGYVPPKPKEKPFSVKLPPEYEV